MVKLTMPEMVTRVPSTSSLTNGRNPRSWLKIAFEGKVLPARTTVARLTEPKIKPTKEARPKTMEPQMPHIWNVRPILVCTPEFLRFMWSAADNRQPKSPIPMPATAELTTQSTKLNCPSAIGSLVDGSSSINGKSSPSTVIPNSIFMSKVPMKVAIKYHPLMN